ncbi:MAG: extracellular solute-binding protein [Anaerocolumna sp.]
MKITKFTRAALLLLVLMIGTAGCDSGNTPTSQSTDSGSGSLSVSASEDDAWQQAKTTPYGKYPELITYTSSSMEGKYDTLAGTKYASDSNEDNVRTRYTKEMLNVQNENAWEASSDDDYNRKVSLAIASGTIPDIMVVNDYATLLQLYDNGLIQDLSEVYKNCTDDRIKEIYDSYDGRALTRATIDGKLMALPQVNIATGPELLWLRQDWLDKLNLEGPKTMADVENILKEFIEKDPGGNGPGKTAGLVVDTSFVGSFSSLYKLNMIFTSYKAYPQQWMSNDKGEIYYGSVQPEAKAALGKLAEWFQAGLIDQQMAVRTADDRTALISSNQCGAFFGAWWGGQSGKDAYELYDAQWQPYLVPQDESGEVTLFTGDPCNKYRVVSKDFAYPEIAAKTLNIDMSYTRYDDKSNVYSEYQDIGNPTVGITVPAYINVDYYDAIYRSYDHIQAAMAGNSPQDIISWEQTMADSIKTDYYDVIKAGQKPTWDVYNNYLKRVVSLKLLSDNKENIKEVNPVFFGQTQSMKLKWTSLLKMENETYLKILTGEAPLDSFDEFVTEWMNAGGKDIINEVTDAVKNAN